jgi:hypothetical protein
MGVRSGLRQMFCTIQVRKRSTQILDFHTEQTFEVPTRFLYTHLKQTRSLIKQNSPWRPWIPEEDVYLVETTFIFTKSNEIHRAKKIET